MRIPGRSRTGTEPVTARSPLGLRLLLSVLYTPVFLAGTVFFALWAADSGPGDSPSAGSLRTIAWICAVLTVVGLIDLVVVLVRRRRERRGSVGGGGRRGP
ncbi:DUF6343 family protein [Streptomyces radiopugnans]|uniref:Uncharacterized protein n=2 Tax=Streptomyces radiopugnans TaxID=403935 RepID=A0A1H9AZ48_9ACTN|nr:DUF6343 family protein [Streptomyces radiopugnans]URN13674.1 DUF6343 family protein [Streptomyces radiopugnans]SEP81795.1 hypothetical protein SAMN05216481_10285 [Streptomyces radiopugnans]